MSVHLKVPFSLPVFADWFQQVKTFSCMIPGLVGLPLELKLYWVGAGYEVVSGSAVTCMVHEINTRGSGGHRSYLVSGWIGLPPVLA